jgi:nucleoside-diphosphate-sugar epimerase
MEAFMINKKKIFITGGAGYIGSILSEILSDDVNNEILILDNFTYNNQSLNHLLYRKNIKIIDCDVRDFDKYKNLLFDYNFFIPLAAIVGAPSCSKNSISSEEINVMSVIKLFNALNPEKHKIIMPTTNSFYGKGGKGNFCDETSDVNPISEYALQKYEVEKKLISFGNFISFRLATVFGASPRMRNDLLVNDFVFRAYFDRVLNIFEGNFKRNYIHLIDVARAFSFAINNYDKLKNNIYNIGLSSANLSKLELANKIKLFIPDLLIIEDRAKKDPDQRNYIVSNNKIEKTGFKTIINIDDGIEELVKYYGTQKKYNFGNI